MSPQSPSLRLIAEATGVSRMTVSLALRNHPSIPESNRKRIQKVAREMGWKPNPIVSDLMSQLRLVTREANPVRIALVSNHVQGKSWRDYPTHMAYYKGAKERAEALGFELEEFPLFKDGMNERRLSQILWTRGIEGLIVFPILGSPGTFKLSMRWDRFVCSTIAFSLSTPILHRSCVNHTSLAMRAVQEACRLGYRRPGLAMEAHQDHRSGHLFLAGYLAACNRQIQPENRIPPLITNDWTEDTFRRWFKDNKPDVVLSIDRPIIDWIERAGCRVPEQIGYISLDLNESMGPISGMLQNSEQVGAAALDMVVAGLRHHERGIPKHPRTVLIEGAWKSGSTTRNMKD